MLKVLSNRKIVLKSALIAIFCVLSSSNIKAAVIIPQTITSLTEQMNEVRKLFSIIPGQWPIRISIIPSMDAKMNVDVGGEVYRDIMVKKGKKVYLNFGHRLNEANLLKKPKSTFPISIDYTVQNKNGSRNWTVHCLKAGQDLNEKHLFKGHPNNPLIAIGLQLDSSGCRIKTKYLKDN